MSNPSSFMQFIIFLKVKTLYVYLLLDLERALFSNYYFNQISFARSKIREFFFQPRLFLQISNSKNLSERFEKFREGKKF